jgi:quinol-cytochrome oxidoreductase complex cytochrome b subunit/coenzyme F420-reducing hydrogenase delta subunit
VVTRRENPGAAESNPLSMPGRALRTLEHRLDGVFGEAHNPMRQLGAIGFYLFWIIAASGIYLYIFFETSVGSAYRSVESLTHDQWYAGGLMRSLHRYASDAFLVVMVLHLARELAYGRFKGFRWFSWLTGIPLIVLTLVAGAGGYALVWDTRAQFTLTAAAEWLGWLPGFGDAIVRNFVVNENFSDRFFSLVVFLHIAVALLLLGGLWIHIQRIARPATQPTRTVVLCVLTLLVACSAWMPALSSPPADLRVLSGPLPFDWFYLAPFPLMYSTSPRDLWLTTTGVLIVLAALPWMARTSRPPVAVVDPVNCNGCARCFADCPFGAVIMAPHSFRPNRQQAVVMPDLCASCGICSGACPSSTPFRSIADLVTGIDMPQAPIGALRDRLSTALKNLTGTTRLIVFGCERGARPSIHKNASVAVLPLLCAGQLPPAFIEFALRHGADGVVIAACLESDCEYRLGTRWTAERIAGLREPHLRANVARDSVRLIAAAMGQDAALNLAIKQFLEHLGAFGSASEPRHA